jgi:hypothetical protein
MTSALLWVIVIGIAGALLSSLVAMFETIRARKDIQSRIHIVPSDEIIEALKKVRIVVLRNY